MCHHEFKMYGKPIIDWLTWLLWRVHLLCASGTMFFEGQISAPTLETKCSASSKHWFLVKSKFILSWATFFMVELISLQDATRSSSHSYSMTLTKSFGMVGSAMTVLCLPRESLRPMSSHPLPNQSHPGHSLPLSTMDTHPRSPEHWDMWRCTQSVWKVSKSCLSVH